MPTPNTYYIGPGESGFIDMSDYSCIYNPDGSPAGVLPVAGDTLIANGYDAVVSCSQIQQGTLNHGVNLILQGSSLNTGCVVDGCNVDFQYYGSQFSINSVSISPAGGYTPLVKFGQFCVNDTNDQSCVVTGNIVVCMSAANIAVLGSVVIVDYLQFVQTGGDYMSPTYTVQQTLWDSAQSTDPDVANVKRPADGGPASYLINGTSHVGTLSAGSGGGGGVTGLGLI
jgi:hypothetical protein